ncbi:putative metalloprotease protein [Eutypa lata UCREL1]|uniref:Putative metalloprotease protein n=1 Tax=Eutypa lata (strain UCR-EL1) TaxID=1287681 RepID=M7T4D3_EUTLA|nr:putative metalloprotease protein [Eutypa lata UCREL1]
MLQELQAVKAAEVSNTLPSILSQEETLTINLYMHGIIDPGQDVKTITEEGMRAQLDVMNQAYAAHGIQFALAGTDITSDAELAYFVPMEKWDAHRVDYVRQSRQGAYHDLNLWYYPSMEAPVVGLCNLPDQNRRINESDWFHDGCHVLGSTMPGGDCGGCSEGYTTIHETGHWLGLLHPWGHTLNDCDGPGDEISDTPAQAGPVQGCPTETPDSCPDQPGVDNADNFMDYTQDSCVLTQKFTPGQGSRMRNNYDWFRL